MPINDLDTAAAQDRQEAMINNDAKMAYCCLLSFAAAIGAFVVPLQFLGEPRAFLIFILIYGSCFLLWLCSILFAVSHAGPKGWWTLTSAPIALWLPLSVWF